MKNIRGAHTHLNHSQSGRIEGIILTRNNIYLPLKVRLDDGVVRPMREYSYNTENFMAPEVLDVCEFEVVCPWCTGFVGRDEWVVIAIVVIVIVPIEEGGRAIRVI